MRKKVIYCFLSLSAILMLLIGTALWLLGTAGGARWMLSLISERSEIKISAGSIEGKLWGDIGLENLEIRWPEGHASAGHMHIVWRPLSLLMMRVYVDELALQHVYIHDNSPQKPVDLKWPTVAGFLSGLSAKIRIFLVKELVYAKLDRPPFAVSEISAAAAWDNGILSMNDLSISMPFASVNGKAYAGLVSPSLSTDLVIDLVQPIEKVKRFSLKAHLGPARKPMQVYGPVSIMAFAAEKEKSHLSAEIGIERKRLVLKKIRLSRTTAVGSIEGEGTISFAEPSPAFEGRIQMLGVDLSPEISTNTNISGSISLKGSPYSYNGALSLINEGKNWRSAGIAGRFNGNREKLRVTVEKGLLLGGDMSGTLEAKWGMGIDISGRLRCRGMSPSAIRPGWTGMVNLDVDASLSETAGRVNARLLDSRLHGRTLAGELDASFEGTTIRVADFLLRGRGFDLRAKGELQQRLTYSANVANLSFLIPGSQGSLHANGWARLAGNDFSGVISAKAHDVVYRETKIKKMDLVASLSNLKDHPVSLKADITGLSYKTIAFDRLSSSINGTMISHKITVDAFGQNLFDMHLALTGSYGSKTWTANMLDLRIRDSAGSLVLEAPVKFLISQTEIAFSPLSMRGAGAERIRANVQISQNGKGFVRGALEKFNFARLNPWLADEKASGEASADFNADLQNAKLTKVDAAVSASGIFSSEGQSVRITKGSLKFRWNNMGLDSSLQLVLGKEGFLNCKIASTSPPALDLPVSANLIAGWKDVDLILLRPWLPISDLLTKNLVLNGKISGHAEGQVFPGGVLNISGGFSINGSHLTYRTEKGQLSAGIKTAEISWAWEGEAFRGDVSLALEEYGSITGRFDLPIPARLPFSPDTAGQVKAELHAKMKENGLLTFIFPAVMRESHGDLDLSLKVSGSWSLPIISGNIQINHAGGFFPSAGIKIENILLQGNFDKNKFVVDVFQARSGQGEIKGSAFFSIEQWRLKSYSGKLEGSDFAVLYLPDIQAEINPKLKFNGDAETFFMRGDIKVQHLLIKSPNTTPPVKPSRDVIMVDRVKKPRHVAFRLDVDANVIFPDSLFVKADGVDAQLDGDIKVTLRDIDDIHGKGVLRVLKGTYKNQGVDLKIERGIVAFTGGKIENPSLNVLALRVVNDIRAGVAVSGPLEQPVIKLYSAPSMPDPDILSYIVFGHPLGGGSGEQAALLAKAADTLLSRGESSVLQDQLKTKFGIDVLDIESVKTPANTPETTTTRSLLTVGKYLTPKLFVSYGQSFFGSGGDLFKMRYSLSKHFEIESESGVESGVDLVYKIDLK